MPRAFIFRYRLLRSRPSSSAVLVTLPLGLVQRLQDVLAFGRRTDFMQAGEAFRGALEYGALGGIERQCRASMRTEDS
jgi:hypothetical protein